MGCVWPEPQDLINDQVGSGKILKLVHEQVYPDERLESRIRGFGAIGFSD
jgi:hypothetical protein